jgi:ADP-ribosyl-[dinitrogen reductase] hydrolase
MKPPLPNSYWVEPGRLLAGEHPDGGTADATRMRIDRLIDAGVRLFIDLTDPDEMPAYHGTLPAHVTYETHAMPDHSVPRSAQQMRNVQLSLERGMAAGGVYVHCRAGIGRTGMTIGCYLREQGETPIAALHELNRLWQQNARAAVWPSTPETEEQEQFIRDWRPQQQVSAGRRGDVVEPRSGLRPLQRYRGCLVALVLADAVAAASDDAATDLHWTDDAGMTLCAAESLLLHRGFDGRDQLQRYREWGGDPGAQGARTDATLRPVVRSVLTRAAWNRSPLAGSHDPTQLDASPLARCAAAALFARGREGFAAALGADMARVTHQAPVLVDACRLLAAMIASVLGGAPRGEVVTTAARIGGTPLRAEVLAVAADWPTPQVGRRRPHAAALGALDRAVRCYARSSSFAEGLTRALAGRAADQDVVCAVYGALAGAHYGDAAIPAELRARVAGLARVEQLADQLFREGSAINGGLE